MKDALNKEIVMGNKYGYSQNNNGITSVRIGTALEETPAGLLKINVDVAKSAYQNAELKECKMERKTIAVKSNMLFPVN